MGYFDAILLGIVQGLTEFLPVSSSGHLVILQYFMGLREATENVTFDLFLHIATLLAVMWVYRVDLKSIFTSVGKAVIVDDEDLIDAVTAVSGSGPAYFFLLMEEMIKAAVTLGLPEDVAKDLVLQTAKGAGLLAVEADKNKESPASLRQKVTSPGGTTEAALKVFAANNLSRLITDALTAAFDRSKELSG